MSLFAPTNATLDPDSLASLLPNPFTPLAFLPPDAAWQACVSSYILVGSLTILIWDILSTMRLDYRLLVHRRFTLPTAVYFASRISTVVYTTGIVVLATSPNGNCRVISTFSHIFYPIGVSASGLLLFFQVRAMYLQNTCVIAFIAALWLSVLGTTLFVLVILLKDGTSVMELDHTKFCIAIPGEPQNAYYVAPLIAGWIYDTTLFIAVVCRVLRCCMTDTTGIKANVQTFVFGKYLPWLSKALLQNEQAYFLSTVVISLATVIMYFIDSLPLQAYRLIMGIPNVVLINIMACKIYRNTRLGIIDSQSSEDSHNLGLSSTPVSGLVFSPPSNSYPNDTTNIYLHDTANAVNAPV